MIAKIASNANIAGIGKAVLPLFNSGNYQMFGNSGDGFT